MIRLRIYPILLLAFFCAALPSACEIPLTVRMDRKLSDAQMAEQLYELAQKENQALQWDDCLGTAASKRAKQLVDDGYFDSSDPKTGKNPVWNAVRGCVPDERKESKVPAAESLSNGVDTPAHVHGSFMKSPDTRKNILDPRFNHIGVGCYHHICVELFAGF